MKKFIAMTALAVGLGFFAPAYANNFVEGQDYKVLDNPENIGGDVIVVREFFWYGCPHCYALEPHMQKWSKSRAKDVAFFRTPAAMNEVWEVPARGFYAAQMMGAEEKTHLPLFNTIHKDGKQVDRNPAQLSDWYATQGLDKGKYDSLVNSFLVTTKIERSKAGAKRYGLTGVPAVVVQGKYVVQGEDEKVTQVVDYLVNKVREEKKAK